MESRANYAAIGAFVLVMVAIGIGLIVWLTNIGQSHNQTDIRIVFAGPVNGLSTGSSVLFNGIKIGEVRLLTLDETDPKTVIAIARISHDIPLKTDTRAMLSFSGLTGAANLQLEGGSRNAPLLFESVGDGGMPTLQADSSPLQDLMTSARKVLERVDTISGSVEDLISRNGPAVDRAIAHIDTFTGALSDNAPGISDALAAFSKAAESVNAIAADLKGSTSRASAILDAVDPDKVTTIVDRLTSSSERLDEVLARASTIADGIDPKVVNQMMTDISGAARKLDETVTQAHDVLAAVDPKAVDQLITRLTGAADGIDAAARRADGLMAAVDPTKVQRIVGSLEATTSTLEQTSTGIGAAIDKAKSAFSGIGDVVSAVDPAKISGTIDDVSTFAASLKDAKPQIDAILADTRAASASLRRLGDTVDARRPDVDAIVGDVKTLAEQLNGIATRADGVIAKVDKYVDQDGDGLVKEATEAARSVRVIADTLKTRVGPIADNVNKFSGRGLDSLVAMADQGRQALARLDRVLQGVESNPQQFIFGGAGVPTYTPNRK